MREKMENVRNPTVLATTSAVCAGIRASNDTVRRMHDDSVVLSNKYGLPIWIVE